MSKTAIPPASAPVPRHPLPPSGHGGRAGPRRSATLVAAWAALTLALAPGAGQATTQNDVVSAVLLGGWQQGDGSHMAALRIDLAPGWKTYWRSPGEAGIPPSFDWSGSDNLASVQPLWPAPSVFYLNGMRSIGYHDQLVLPLQITARDPSRPVTLNARIDLGICRDICLPATLTVAASLTPPGANDPAIRASLAAMPHKGAEAGLRSASCVVEPISDGLRITATLALPRQGRDEVVAFETADPSIWVAESRAERRGEHLVATTDLVPPSGRPFALDRSGMTLTVLSDRGAVEIDGCPAP